MTEPTHAHVDEWNRFIVRSRDYYAAARVAALSGWWLHCWSWEETDWDYIEIYDTKHDTIVSFDTRGTL